jgi:putative chitinase
MIDAINWLHVLTYCGVRAATAVEWVDLFEKHIQPANFSLGERELDDFIGQILHETRRLEALEENLSYSPQRLCEVWPGRFPGVAAAKPYAWNEEALAEKVYGYRHDLGNTRAGDGYRFRGRGIPMITGRANYGLLAQLTGMPLLDQPELLAEKEPALLCAVLWWEKMVPDSAIDTIDRVTRAVNGGEIGIEDRQALTEKAGAALA